MKHKYKFENDQKMAKQGYILAKKMYLCSIIA